MELLKQLTVIRGASSDEGTIAQFILDYVAQNAPTYANKTAGGSYGVQMESFF